LWFGSPVRTSSYSSRYVLLALGELLSKPAQLPHGQPGKPGEAKRNEPGDREDVVHHRGRRPFRLPAEPADDAAVAVEQGMDLAFAADRLSLELQSLEAGGALEHVDELGLDAREIGGDRLQRLDCPGQCLAVLSLEVVVGLPRQHVAEPGADQDHRHDQEGERRDQAQHHRLAAGGAGGPLRVLARPGAQRPEQAILEGRIYERHR